LYLEVNKRNILTQMQMDIKRKGENKSIVPIAKDTPRATIFYHNPKYQILKQSNTVPNQSKL
jgi:hypothetical protein